MTHTYSTLAVSNAAYQEVKRKLLAAGEDARINAKGEIDMDGTALILQDNVRYSLTPEGRQIVEEALARKKKAHKKLL